MPVGAFKERWMISGDRIEVLAGGQCFIRPPGLVPARPQKPGAILCFECGMLDACFHLSQRSDTVQINGKFLPACGAKVRMGIVEAGHDECALEIDELRSARI